MGVTNNTKLALIVVVALMVVAAPASEAVITCGTVTKNLVGCLPYLRSGGTPSPACCRGVKTLSSAATTTADRRAACACLKQAASSFPGFFKYAGGLPGKCGVSVPYPISPNTDCSK